MQSGAGGECDAERDAVRRGCVTAAVFDPRLYQPSGIVRIGTSIGVLVGRRMTRLSGIGVPPAARVALFAGYWTRGPPFAAVFREAAIY